MLFWGNASFQLPVAHGTCLAAVRRLFSERYIAESIHSFSISIDHATATLTVAVPRTSADEARDRDAFEARARQVWTADEFDAARAAAIDAMSAGYAVNANGHRHPSLPCETQPHWGTSRPCEFVVIAETEPSYQTQVMLRRAGYSVERCDDRSVWRWRDPTGQ